MFCTGMQKLGFRSTKIMADRRTHASKHYSSKTVANIVDVWKTDWDDEVVQQVLGTERWSDVQLQKKMDGLVKQQNTSMSAS